jgi:hypothetical protein
MFRLGRRWGHIKVNAGCKPADLLHTSDSCGNTRARRRWDHVKVNAGCKPADLLHTSSPCGNTRARRTTTWKFYLAFGDKSCRSGDLRFVFRPGKRWDYIKVNAGCKPADLPHTSDPCGNTRERGHILWLMLERIQSLP